MFVMCVIICCLVLRNGGVKGVVFGFVLLRNGCMVLLLCMCVIFM